MESIINQAIRDWSGHRWEKLRFRKHLVQWLKDSAKFEDQDEIEEVAGELNRRIPDLFRFESDTAWILEIEETSPLTESKLRDYCRLWNALDFYDLKLEVIVTDRYGLNPRQLPLGNYWLSTIAADANSG